MTTNQAKKIVENFLKLNHLDFTRLTSKTVSFRDLARDSKIFVVIHGWKPNPMFTELSNLANRNDFCITAEGDVF